VGFIVFSGLLKNRRVDFWVVFLHQLWIQGPRNEGVRALI